MTKCNNYNPAAFLLLFALQCLPCLAKEYHIDSQKQFDVLCTTAFLPGDTILFKRGVQFDGMFAPSGNGTEQAPIRIGVYGFGQRPKINSHGKHIAGVFLKDASYWEVNGLEITNTDGTDKDQGELFGIYALAKGAEGTYKHIYSSSKDGENGAPTPMGLIRHFAIISTSTFRRISRTPHTLPPIPCLSGPALQALILISGQWPPCEDIDSSPARHA